MQVLSQSAYTGIARGKRLLVLVGQKKALGIAVRTTTARRGGIRGSSPACEVMSDTLRLLLHSNSPVTGHQFNLAIQL